LSETTDAVNESVVIELNPRERRLYDRLRAQVVKASPGGASGFRDVILLLPDLTVLLLRLLRDSRVPISCKAVAVLGIGYALSPIDLVPSFLVGPIGLADDLLVVSAALSKILNQVHPDIVRSHWSGKGDALDAIQRASRWSASILFERIPRRFRRRN
jgi:uncharacterized membrane protein YkvA (DUF1232 family)